MQTYENIRENERGEFVTASGRIFRPLYKGMLDKMPADIVHELAKRRLAELDETGDQTNPASPQSQAPKRSQEKPVPRTGAVEGR